MEIAAEVWSWVGPKATGTAFWWRTPRTWRVHKGQLSTNLDITLTDRWERFEVDLVPSAEADGQLFFHVGAYDPAVEFADLAITLLPA